MPVNKINPNVPSQSLPQTQNARPAAPTGANSFASKLAAQQRPQVAQQQGASKSVQQPSTEPTADDKMEALREIMRQQSLMMSQQIMASGGNAPKPDSE